ncbi:MAG: alpha/beta hydrolase fold domain-containing protein [Microbacterium sp.]
MASARHPFDRELAAALPPSSSSGAAPTVDALRSRFVAPRVDALLDEAGVDREDVVVTGHDGAALEMSVLRSRRARHGQARRAAVYSLHGGGMILGTRFTGLGRLVDWVTRLDVVVVAVEYRLAPEFPDPVPIEDVYAGWRWLVAHAGERGIDLDRTLIAGASAGGGLAAGVCLAARDRGERMPAGQLLLAPMIDDRLSTASAAQFAEGGTWDRASNLTGWDALLGDRRGGEDVSPYAAPARAEDLRQLPPAYLDCGDAELFRDETVAYATALWLAGVPAELHVWAGGYHSFDALVPDAAISRAASEARRSWIARTLGLGG